MLAARHAPMLAVAPPACAEPQRRLRRLLCPSGDACQPAALPHLAPDGAFACRAGSRTPLAQPSACVGEGGGGSRLPVMLRWHGEAVRARTEVMFAPLYARRLI